MCLVVLTVLPCRGHTSTSVCLFVLQTRTNLQAAVAAAEDQQLQHHQEQQAAASRQWKVFNQQLCQWHVAGLR
jgi:hypothetical protein